MLIIKCPYCGVEAEETENTAGGESHLERFGPDFSDEEFEEFFKLSLSEEERSKSSDMSSRSLAGL